MSHKFFTSILSLVILIPINNTQILRASSIKDHKQEFDIHLEVIDQAIQSQKYSEACDNAIKAAKVVKQNIKELRKLEPYYNWREMREVLLEVPLNLCG